MSVPFLLRVYAVYITGIQWFRLLENIVAEHWEERLQFQTLFRNNKLGSHQYKNGLRSNDGLGSHQYKNGLRTAPNDGGSNHF
jgi:hypothetical protein